MIKSKGIFAVSFIAMMVVGGAYANIASQGYVDQEVGKRLSTVNTTGTGDVVTAVSANNETGVVTVERGKTMPTKTSDLTNDSGFITAAALPEEYTLPAATATALGGVKSGGDITVAADGAVTVNSATTADSATKATQDAAGNVIADTYATKAEIPDEITVDAALSADSTNPVQNKVVKAELDKKLENTATGTGSLSTGGATPATAVNAVVIGDAASGAAASVVVGKSAKSSETGLMNVAVGMNASANDREAVAIGSNANVAGQGVAIGTMAKTTVAYGTAVGYRAETGAGTAIAIGQSATSTALGAIQLGSGTNSTEGTFNVGFGANKNYQLLDNDGKIPDERMPDTVLTNEAVVSNSLGVGVTVAQESAVAVGVPGLVQEIANGGTLVGAGANVAASGGVAIGAGAISSGTSGAIGIGGSAYATAEDAIAIGRDARAQGANSIQIGNGLNQTANTFSVGLGDGSTASNYTLLKADGTIPAERMPGTVLKNIAGGHHSMAIGETNITDDVLSATVVGEEATVSATGGAAYGAYATAGASGATALGMEAEASGEGSVAVGQNAAASYANGVAIGNTAQISGPLAIAVGSQAQSLGQAAVAIGPASKGLGSMGVAIGAAANATATGAIQLGRGENSEAGAFKVGSYKLLDANGKIPGERLQISVGSATDPTGYADIWIE